MIDEAALQALIDKQAITEALYAYCRAVDRLDVPLGRSLWHDDAVADYGASYYHGPGRDVIDLICSHHTGLLSHSHQVANILITLDGDRAGSEAYITGTMRLERDGQLTQLGVWGRYLDTWERRPGALDGRWGIVHRRVVIDHDEVRPVTTGSRKIDFRQNRSDPSYDFLGEFAL